MQKGNSIHEFLQRCLENLRKEFPELRAISVDSLMYIKEDLIIPHVRDRGRDSRGGGNSLQIYSFYSTSLSMILSSTKQGGRAVSHFCCCTCSPMIITLLHPGPLFSFDVHEDVRLLNDAAVEKDEVIPSSSVSSPRLE